MHGVSEASWEASIPREAEVQKSAELPHPYFLTPHHANPTFTLFQIFCLVALPQTKAACLSVSSFPSHLHPTCIFLQQIAHVGISGCTGICSAHLCLLRHHTAGLSLRQGNIFVSPGLADRSNGTLCKLPFRKVGGPRGKQASGRRRQKEAFRRRTKYVENSSEYFDLS